MSARITAHELARFCVRHGMAESRFGRETVNDPRLLRDLRNGREPRAGTVERVRSYMTAREGVQHG